jgi:hypothetical protein
LRLQGGALEAAPQQVNPAFAEQVRQGAYKKISAAFYAPDSPHNPKPGVYYLKHVGFLGAMPPAVKGMRDPAFAEGGAAGADSQDGVVVFSELLDAGSVTAFGEWDDTTNAGLWRSLREWLIGKFGREEADAVIPGFEVRNLELGAQDELREAAQEQQASAELPLNPQFSEPKEPVMTPEQIAALQAERDRIAAELARLQAAQREQEEARAAAQRTQVQAGALAFAEGLVAQGRLEQGRAAPLAAALAALEGGTATTGTVEFGEGEQRAAVAPLVRELLGKLPVMVDLGEVATAGAAGVASVAFAEGAASGVDRQALHRKVVAYRAAHPGTGYEAALDAVQAGRQ